MSLSRKFITQEDVLATALKNQNSKETQKFKNDFLSFWECYDAIYGTNHIKIISELYLKSTDESTFNYVKHTYHNGNGKDYSEKTILNKDGNIVCVLGDRYDENGNKTTVEIMRAGYDEYGRAETITDKSLCNFDNASGVAEQAVVYNNIYSDDGELKRVNISGEISGSFSEITDDTGKVISKTVECFGEQKIYGYKYDNCFGNDYPDNRLSKILLPGDTAGVVFIKSS